MEEKKSLKKNSRKGDTQQVTKISSSAHNNHDDPLVTLFSHDGMRKTRQTEDDDSDDHLSCHGYYNKNRSSSSYSFCVF